MYFVVLMMLVLSILIIVRVKTFSPRVPLNSNSESIPELSHFTLKHLAGQFEYPVFQGLCFGFTLNWSYAVALGQEEFFYQQMHAIRTFKNNLPNTVKDITFKKQNHWAVTDEEHCVSSLPALFEKICVAQNPLAFRERYGKLVWQPDINSILQNIHPHHLYVKQVFLKTHTFRSRKEAQAYFETLIELGISERVAIIISSSDHSMGFRRFGNTWHFININFMFQQNPHYPYFECSTSEIVQELYRGSSDDPSIRRLTVNTDYIAIESPQVKHSLKPLKELWPVSMGQQTSYKDQLSFFAMAAFQGDLPTVRTCLQRGLSIFSNHHIQQDSPILTAIYHGRREVVSAMMSSIEHRINYKIKTTGATLLHVACKVGSIGIIEDLLKVPKIIVDPRDLEGMTPLMYACLSEDTKENPDLFRLLFSRNASITVTDRRGLTALDHAFQSMNQTAIKMIQERQNQQSSTDSVAYIYRPVL